MQKVRKKFDTSSYEDTERSLPLGKNKTTMRLMKDKLGGETIKETADEKCTIL